MASFSVEKFLETIKLSGLGEGIKSDKKDARSEGLLTKEMKESLLSLRWSTGDPLLNFETQKSKDETYEIINLYMELWVPEIYIQRKEDVGYIYLRDKLNDRNFNYLDSRRVKNLIFDSNIYLEAKRKYQIDIVRQRDDVVVGGEGVYTCIRPSCKSKNTRFVQKQTASADEQMKVSITCFACGMHWSK